MAKHIYGKDHPEKFIEGALDGDIHGEGHSKGFQDSMTSNEMVEESADRGGQKILTPFALDNVGRVYDRFPTSMRDTGGIRGGPENLKHSLTGASAVNDGVDGKPVKNYIANH